MLASKFLTVVTFLGCWLRTMVGHRKRPTLNVIYKPDAIGDFVLATGAIRRILEDESAPWALVVSPAVSILARQLFPGIHIVTMEGADTGAGGQGARKLLSIQELMIKWKIGKLVCLRHARNPMDDRIFRLLRPEVSMGVTGSPLSGEPPSMWIFDIQAHYPLVRRDLPLELAAHAEVIRAGFPGETPEKSVAPFFPRSYTENPEAPFLLVSPVTRSKLRNYPLDSLAKVLNDFMHQEFQYQVILMGLPSDSETLDKLKFMLVSTSRVRIQYPASILEASRLIESASILLCMESAPAHIATAMDIPMVCMLGGGHFNHFAPWGNPDRQVWLSQPMPCFQCGWNCPYEKPNCLTAIPVLQVEEQLIRLSLMAVNPSGKNSPDSPGHG